MKMKKNKHTGRHNDYFMGLNALLKEKGPGHPVLVLDLDILDRNIEKLKIQINDPSRFRLVVKSLPCMDLIRHILSRTRTKKLMVFHRPFLNLAVNAFLKSLKGYQTAMFIATPVLKKRAGIQIPLLRPTKPGRRALYCQGRSV